MATQEVPINPAVLAWAIHESGYSPGKLAERLGLEQRQVDAWLEGVERPHVTEWRKLAAVLHRPTATFLLPAAPKTALPRVAFRHPPGRAERSFTPTERLHLREALRLQRGLRWVTDELKEALVRLPKVDTKREDPEQAARSIRQTLNVSVKTQAGWKSEYAALRAWRQLVENAGVAVLALPMGADSARGFSVWDDRVPLIALNTHWGPSARIFTLFHELGHLMSRTSSMCEEVVGGRHKGTNDPVERWCEAFAAAALVPWAAAERYLVTQLGWNGHSRITDLNVVTKLSRHFKVSLRASALRLIGRGVAEWSLYNALPRASEGKSGGGGGGGRRRPDVRRDQYGSRTARIFQRGLERDVLGRDDVLAYLNVGDGELQTFLSPSVAA